jgi:ADP-ribosylation factor protein 6
LVSTLLARRVSIRHSVSR